MGMRKIMNPAHWDEKRVGKGAKEKKTRNRGNLEL
jgi:hypothetical protein